MSKRTRYCCLGLLSFVGAIALWLFTALPGLAHWADLAAAEIVVGTSDVQMTLTVPTGLIAFADDNQDGQLTATEVRRHGSALRERLHEQIRLTDSDNQPATLAVAPINTAVLSPSALLAPSSHTTLSLSYTWDHAVQGMNIHYGFFLPGVSTASCLATILQAGHLKTFVFTPENQQLALVPGLQGFATEELLLALLGAFIWGATHSLSPGHGKTLVGAYLVGERATPLHAIVLAGTTTITHTIGVFALGLITLFAARYILPEQLYPWLSLVSGLMVVAIGLNLLITRLYKHRHHSHAHPHSHAHEDDRHSGHHQSHTHASSDPDHPNYDHHGHDSIHDTHSVDSVHFVPIHHHEQTVWHSHRHHDHGHHHHHEHHGNHGGVHHRQGQSFHGHHSHLPPQSDESPVTWKSLLALGISGGLIPCPAALVLLLSAIALGNASLGLLLVLAFSLGLAIVLTGLGLLLVYAKRFFKRVPARFQGTKILPAMSAIAITLIGFGISTKALMQLNFLF